MQIQDRTEDVEHKRSCPEPNMFYRVLSDGLEKLVLKKHRFVFFFILALSAFLRFYHFPGIPTGINQDEASDAYDAYSLLLHGTDRWGNRFPVYFPSWGVGQSVLQSYLNIPFIKVFGLTIFAERLLPNLLGLLTIVVLYKVVKKIYDTKAALLAAFLLGTIPWHIILSRWSLEENILSCFLLLGVGTLLYCYESKYNRLLIPFSLTFLALSVYAYGVAFLIVPVILVLYFLSHFKTIWKHKIGFILSLGFFLLITFPFLLFFLDNFILHKTPEFVTHLPFTVPLLVGNRVAQLSAGEDILSWNEHFVTSGFNDGQIWNSIGWFQPLGLLNLPLAIVGIYYSLRKRQAHADIFVYWLVATLPFFFRVTLNINNGTAIFLPLIVLSAIGMIGIYNSIDKKNTKTAFLSLMLVPIIVYNGLFCYDYFNHYNTYIRWSFNSGFDVALAKATSAVSKDEPVYVSDQINGNYIYLLFFLRVDPQDFQQHSQVVTVNDPYQPINYEVLNYRNYYFWSGDGRLASAPSYVGILKGNEDLACKRVQVLFSDSENGWKVERCFNF